MACAGRWPSSTPPCPLDLSLGPAVWLVLLLVLLLVVGLAVWLVGGLVGGLAGGLVGGLAGGLVGGLVGGLAGGLVGGLAGGPVVGLASRRFAIARCWLALRGKLPWRLMGFLADAHQQRGVLRQVGAVYQFRHIQLQRRLASRSWR